MNAPTSMRGADLVLAGALVALGCEAPPAGERRELSTAANAPQAAIALVASPKHDFGRAIQGDTLRHAFITRNTTPGALAIEDTRAVLGCSGKPVPRVLAAGMTGKLEVECRANTFGPLRVSLPLRAGGRAAGELALAAEIEPLLAFDRSLLEVNVAFGTEGSAQARLRGARAAAARLVPLASTPEGLAATLLPAMDGASQGVALRADGSAAGTRAGSLRFATGLSEPKEIELAYLVKVASTLTVSPTNPVLALGASEGARTIVQVTSQNPRFRVERVKVLEGPFEARARRDGDAYAIEVSLVAAKVLRAQRGENGRLLIVSNDRAEPNKEVPLFALGVADAGEPGGR